MSSKQKKITVLLDHEDFHEFDRFCRENGFKKSTLIARLLKDFMTQTAKSKDKPMPLFEPAGTRDSHH